MFAVSTVTAHTVLKITALQISTECNVCGMLFSVLRAALKVLPPVLLCWPSASESREFALSNCVVVLFVSFLFSMEVNGRHCFQTELHIVKRWQKWIINKSRYTLKRLLHMYILLLNAQPAATEHLRQRAGGSVNPITIYWLLLHSSNLKGSIICIHSLHWHFYEAWLSFKSCICT